MHDACLHPRLGEHSGDRVGEPGQAIDAGDQDVIDVAALQVIQDGQPEFRALGLLPPDSQGFAVAFDGHADGEIAGAGADRAVFADLDVHGVEVDDRVDALQRP